MKARFLSLLPLFALCWAAAGCSLTHPLAVWKNEQFAGGPIKTVMVVGVAEKSVSRKDFEQKMAERLRSDGIEAIPSVEVLPTDKELTRETVENTVRHTGIGGVLVVQILEKEATLRPASDTKYYDFTKTYVYNPVDKQFYDATVDVKVESMLYETTRGDAIWSLLTQTHGPASANYLMNSVIDVIVPALRKTGFFGK